ncbi:MAG: dephospho-CoA kinase [Pseudobdellovibrionaceae bacterium]
MFKLGLTGSIAMGKSTVAAMFEKCGVAVHDSDAVVHSAYEPDSSVFTMLGRLFPEAWNKKTLRIDRAKLAEIIYTEPEARRALEGLLHPYVWDAQDSFLRKHRRMGTALVVFDIPLLYETGAENRLDAVCVATAPKFLQQKRALRRPNMSEEKLRSILDTQLPDPVKRKRADYIVHTGLGHAFAMREVRAIVKDILEK